MHHVAAPLRLVHLAWLPLWAVVLAPLAFAAAAAVFLHAKNLPRLQSLQGAARTVASRLGLTPAGLGALAGLGLAAAGVLVAVVQAVTKKGLVLSPGPRVFRLGSLDATLAASLDLPRGALGLLALAGLAVLLGRAGSREGGSAGPSSGLAVAALASGVLGVVLGDGVALIAVGLELLVVGAVLYGFESGAADPRPAIVVLGGGQLAVASFVLALGYVAWGAGGSWLEGPGEAPGSAVFLPAKRARFAAAERGDKPRHEADSKSTKGRRDAAVRARELSKARAFLTMTSHPGARVFLGVADQQQLRGAQPIGVSPFVRLPVPAGVQTLAISPEGGATIGGDGWEVASIENVMLEADEERTLVALGPSLTLSELDAQAQIVAEDGGGVVTPTLQNARPLGRLGASVAGLGMLGVLAWTGAIAFAASPKRRLAGGVRGPALVVAGSVAAACFSALLFPRLAFLWEAAQGGRLLALFAWAIALAGGALGLLASPGSPGDGAAAPSAPARAPGRREPAEEPAEEAAEEPAEEAVAKPAPPKRKTKKRTRKGPRA